VGASSNRAGAMCPTVATDDTRPPLLGHHSSDGTAATDRLSVAIENYGPSVHMRIIVMLESLINLMEL
jgi:hypothetical protein